MKRSSGGFFALPLRGLGRRDAFGKTGDGVVTREETFAAAFGTGIVH